MTIMFNCIYYKPPILDDYLYPDWAASLSWLIGLFPIMLVPGYAIYKMCMDGGFEVSSIYACNLFSNVQID